MAQNSPRLIAPTNQYLGINAHLHSHFLHRDPQGWEEFHSDHITDLTRAMNQILTGMGYIARKERSLQIRYFDDTPRNPISDVLIGDLSPTSRLVETAFSAQTAAQGYHIPASALLDDPTSDIKRPWAIKIYEGGWGGDDERGIPVVWIELLSPSNKSGAGYVDYTAKRDALLANRLVFVEIDYLQGISTTLEKIPDYRPVGREQMPSETAHPYHIWLIDPRLPFDDDQSGAIAPFDVDQPLPMMTIPLNRGDALHFDFNAVYHQTFRAQPAYSLAVDYAQPPEDVTRDYNFRDQIAIAARMLTVQERKRAGLSLAENPLPVDSVLLERLRQEPERLVEVFG